MKAKGCTGKTRSAPAERDTTPGDKSTVFYRDLEDRASRYSVHAVRLQGKRHAPLGLLLINNGASGQEVEAALAGLGLSARTFADGLCPVGTAPRHAPGNHAQLLDRLTVELDRVQRTRLPCALLLATTGADPERAATAIEPCLHQVDIVVPFAADGLALILPGTNLGKAKKRAEEFRAALGRGDGHGRHGMAFGLAVCHAYDTIAADQLLAAATTELKRAAATGGNAICHAAPMGNEHSCQVTVEERAHLFSAFIRADETMGLPHGNHA